MQGNEPQPSEENPATDLNTARVAPVESEHTPFDKLPDESRLGDESKPAHASGFPTTAWPTAALDSEEEQPKDANSDRASAFGGCSTGALSLMPFLFVLAMVRKAGLPLDASTMMAFISGGILMAIAVKSWPRRTIFWLGGYVVGLLVAYALLWFILRPFVVSEGRNASPATGQTTMPIGSQ